VLVRGTRKREWALPAGPTSKGMRRKRNVGVFVVTEVGVQQKRSEGTFAGGGQCRAAQGGEEEGKGR